MDSLSATAMRASHGQSIGLSIVMILAGVLAIAAPLVAGISTIIWIAWLLVASGAAHLALDGTRTATAGCSSRC